MSDSANLTVNISSDDTALELPKVESAEVAPPATPLSVATDDEDDEDGYASDEPEEVRFTVNPQTAEYVRSVKQHFRDLMINQGYTNDPEQTKAIMRPGNIFWALVTEEADESPESQARNDFYPMPTCPIFCKCRRLIAIRDQGDQLAAVAEHTRGGHGLEGLVPGEGEYEDYVRLVDPQTFDQSTFPGGVGAYEPVRLHTGAAGTESLLKLEWVHISKREYVKAADATLAEGEIVYLSKVVRDAQMRGLDLGLDES